MITHPDKSTPTVDELAQLIASDTRAEAQIWADAGAATTELFGDAVLSNMFVVGMAVQSGHLPVSVESIERAIELNGVAVEKNLSAFGWGRAHVERPELLDKRLSKRSGTLTKNLPPHLVERVDALTSKATTSDEKLRAEIERRTVDLIGFQSEQCAEGYLDTLEKIARIGDQSLLEAVAVNLHKLTAYKDEYEVARLMLADDGLAEARAIANGGAMAYKLHPPMLRALGVNRKITISTKASPALRALAAGKRLRGTPVDPFGRAEVRIVERELLTEYRDAINELARGLSPDDRDRIEAAIEIATLPDMVRGYEDLKLEQAKRYRAELDRRLTEFRTLS